MAVRYQHIADDLRNLITTGALAAGQQLPPEEELASRYKVSKPTLRYALELLQGEGLVEKFHGRGNFVRRPTQRITYVNDRRAADQQVAAPTELHVSVSTNELDAPADLSALLQVPLGSQLTEYIYLSHQGVSALSLARVYVPRSVATFNMPETSRSPWGCDVRDHLAAAGIQFAAVVERVTARPPTLAEAQTLGITTRAAVLAVERTWTDTTGRVVEVAFLVLLGDRTEAVFITSEHDQELETSQ
ncbi:GntR family transcriptional regulator [Streptomyces sp. H27-C3]|uniref:GntR family transcriptional regulator n=1 Tax=Streptomyces sp. H27-C3 TaxID=3046305 RepID=UPI0024B9D583|nr:GntR family transcriptional regulator [Streptomyces sp. H27-C3]MDJ0461494.1 GntR family transcriptional regulator [Streptomyces sp. H27-C3]